ncbi:MAG TPA: hypothetical protein VI793_17240 [Anaerolineales bacterium]|nr:hypothetical protein [Anaerolineales bacterium]
MPTDLLKDLVSAWLVRDFFDHPQTTQFYGREFRAGLKAVGLRVQKWWQWGEWGIMGQAGKQTALEKINA